MVKGKYYYVWDDNYSGFMIGKCLGAFTEEDEFKRCNATFICTFPANKSLINKYSWCYESNQRHYREATTDEIEWLELCIKKGKFIEKPINLIYELW